MSSPTIAEVLSRSASLPTFPEVARFIVSAIDDESAGADALVDHINTDPVVVARILAAANSAAFGLAARVDSVRQAILLLGLENVKRITLATSIIDRYRQGAAFFDPRLLWRHSLGVALCASALAEHAGYRAESAFTAGLLHDIGQLLLFAVAPDRFIEVIERRQRLDESITAAEQAVFGFDHAAVGSELVRQWRLPTEIADGIRGHHTPEHGDASEIGDIIHVAETLSHALDLGELANNRVPDLSDLACARIGLDWDEFAVRFAEIEARHEEILAALGL
jgi:putative nucleotidyltransferase with HDIG domain